MEKRTYNISDRDTVFIQAASEKKTVVEDVTTDLDENGRPTKCFVVVEDVPPAEPDLLAEADERILELEYENLILKEGLA